LNLYNNYNINDVKDKLLIDVNNEGKFTDWQGKKLKTIELAESYRRLGEEFKNKHIRVRDCGTFLEFKKYINDNSMKLNQANFCKVRLCPMCSWRRSLKIYGQVSKIMNEVVNNEDLEFIFLTLTTRNCEGKDLSDTIDNIFNAFNNMTKRGKFKKAVKGYFRALEVTHNLNYMSDWFDTYHPHLHCILVVNKSYFNSRDYISQNEWTEIWKNVLKVDYTPIVDVRRFKDRNGKGIEKSIAETAKYTVKSDDYIIHDDLTNEVIEHLTDDAVFILDKALAHRRLTAFGGILKEYHKKLNLDDAEYGDLVNTDNEELREDLEYIIERYSWNIGYKQYLRVD